ncbi:MAG: hypothetical protein JNK91_04395 [Ferruginibacter sp.]|nr:hypothetical protein [Ferruginibacter sp.]
MYNLKVLSLILVATALAYATHLFLKKKIDPRKSGLTFILYMLAHLASIVIWVFLFGLTLTYFRDWFFRK